MARYIVRRSYIDILGGIWWPYGAVCSLRKDLTEYDIANIRAYDDSGRITREAVEQWVAVNSGDFSSVIDFAGSIEDGDQTVDLGWSNEENEIKYLDTIAED